MSRRARPAGWTARAAEREDEMKVDVKTDNDFNFFFTPEPKACEHCLMNEGNPRKNTCKVYDGSKELFDHKPNSVYWNGKPCEHFFKDFTQD